MTVLLYFILGIAFYGLVIPICESIVSLICTFFEYQKGKLSLKMVKLQMEIDKSSDKVDTYAIGFDTSDGITLEDLEEEEEEEDF